MDALLASVSNGIASFVEIVAALIIFGGAIEAIYGIITRVFLPTRNPAKRKEIWTRFALWLVLALEFTLAADVVRSAVHPTWTSIGQLGAIAVIRTFLSAFLERDLRDARAWNEGG
ncbi:MAG TPA: DUF1622 domain-containing protein [Candidatus Tumulicola sp.]